MILKPAMVHIDDAHPLMCFFSSSPTIALIPHFVYTSIFFAK